MSICSSLSNSDDFRSADESSDSTDSFVSVPSLTETLTSTFSDVSKNFNAVHINAQSIPAHFPDMLASFDCKDIHAILISESWLKPCLPTISYTIPGFNLIRNDRTAGRGGGVAIYLRTNIPFSITDISAQPPPQNAGEHLFLEILLHNTKVLLGVFYCPSSNIDYFSSFDQLLEKLTPSYSHTIIFGDFNTCLLQRNSRTSRFQSTMASYNLSTLPLGATHHFPNCTPSLLDLIIVSSPSFVAKHGQCSADAFSYHDLIFLSYKVRPLKAKSKILMQRNFSGMKLEELRKDASDIDWTPVISSNCIDIKVNLFTSILTQLYDKHAPIRAIKIKHLPAPWLTDDIKKLMGKKNALKSKYKARPTCINREKYVAIRNHCNKACRNAQRQHIHESVQNGDPSKVWKFLRSMGVGKLKQDAIPKTINIDLLNKHFSTSSNFDGTTKNNTLNYLSSLPTPGSSSFVFNQFSDCDVKKSIESITSNAVGSDCVSRNMILPILNEILPTITHILNHSISFGVFPSIWKEAQITPLPKKSNPKLFSDLRPISILPFLSKVLERLACNQLSAFLNKNRVLNAYQSGFRPGHSTVTALVHITDDIRLAMENGNLTLLTLLDFSNAFNTVDFDVLTGILCSLNISPTAVDWFRSYLLGRRQRIRIDDTFSSWCDISAGVPQGGVLSPLLFAIFINSISYQLQSSYHLYADDLQIYTHAPPATLLEAITTTNTDLVRISQWSKSYGLKINPSKTQAIIIGSPNMTSRINWAQTPQICFEGAIVPFTDKVKNLGILIDSNLTWVPQLQEISRKIYASASSLRRLRNFLPIATKITLAQSLLLPILDYADASYPDVTEEQLNKLERLQNFCIRFIFGLRKYDHVSEFRIKLKWLPIRHRRDHHMLCLLYNILFNPTAPSYLSERFDFLNDTHDRLLRSSENLILSVPVHSTKFMDKSFVVRSVRLWNALPLHIRQSQSLILFKELVKSHFLKVSSNFR